MNTHRVRRAFAATAVLAIGAAGCTGESVVGTPTEPVTAHVLRVQAEGRGSGTVTAPDASPQIACSISGGALAGVCGMAYPTNSAVLLIATPNVGSTFLGWSGACSGTEQCVVDMSNERTVIASFAVSR